jgi:ligand-binding sensor domain-containing protein
MKLLFLLQIFFILPSLFAQTFPISYKLEYETNLLSKVLASTPTSNSIIDIITVGDTVWLGTSRGVSLSVDKGETWTNFYGRPDFGTDNVSAIGYNNGVFWCATAKSVEVPGGQKLPSGTGLKYTFDKGHSWISIPQPVDNPNDDKVQYGINQLKALPITVTIQNLTYDIAFTPGTIWIASFAGGLRKSTDNGVTWQRVVLPPDRLNSIKPTDTLDFCLSPVAGSFCSEGNLNHRVFSIASDNNSTIYVGTANGINKSTDGGISWLKFNHQNQANPISGNFITAIRLNPQNNSIWASTWKAEDQNEFYAVSFSLDGGNTWNTTLHGERPHNFAFKFDQSFVLSSNGAFRTTDLGRSWILPNAITDSKTRASIRTNTFYSAGISNEYIFLGSDDGLARLKETFGNFWQGEWKVYLASKHLITDSETYCYPNPFSPRQDLLKIKYSTKGKFTKVTIRVFDFAFNHVRTIIQNVDRKNDLEGTPEIWDGKDENGNIVPNGVYFYRVDIGDDDQLFGKILVLQ